jgi:hypothetical protein
MHKADESNSVTVRALRALAGPWPLALVLLLLLNDHVLRRRWPGWVTGKLGDVAWLAFAPLVVAVPLSLLWPRGHSEHGVRRRGDAVILVAMAFVGGLFGVVKALPAPHAGFVAGFRAVFGWTPMLVRDPTDLLALPALGIAWLLWRGSLPSSAHARTGRAGTVTNGALRLTGASALPSVGEGTKGSVPRGASIPRRGWWVLALAALATLANAALHDEGILCVVVDEGQLIAGPPYSYGQVSTFASDDGGLSWKAIPVRSGIEESPLCDSRDAPWTLEVPDAAAPSGQAIYRFTHGEAIEWSLDGGTTWVTSLDLRGNEARVAYYQATRVGVAGYPGPHEAVVDPGTGNLVVAMGHEGVLVRRAATGDWQWVAVGDYRFEHITRPNQVVALLWGELWFAAAAALVALSLGGLDRLRWVGRAVAVVLALGVTLALPALRPATVTGYADVIVGGALIGLSVGALPLAIVAGVRMARRGGVLRAMGVGIGTGLLGLLPFVLWALGVIAAYTAAAWIAVVVLTFSFLATGLLGARPRVG